MKASREPALAREFIAFLRQAEIGDQLDPLRLHGAAPGALTRRRYNRSPAWTGRRSGSPPGWRRSSSAILLVISLPLAHWIVFSRRRWTFLVESVVSLPLVLPPTVLGFYLLMAIGHAQPARPALDAPGPGHPLAFTFEGLVVASLFYSLPFAVQPIAAAFSQIDPTLREASATLGASPLRTFMRVVLPLSIEGVIAGVVLSFAHTVGEFGVVLMVGGNLPGVTRTVSICHLRPRAGAAVPRGRPSRRSSCSPSRSRCCSSSTACAGDRWRPRPWHDARRRACASGCRRGSRSTCRSVAEPGVTILFGASGSGKTTILRCVAGLARPDAGRDRHRRSRAVRQRRGVDVPVPERRIGYVFQQLALFPHLTRGARTSATAWRRLPRDERQHARRRGRRVVPHRRPARPAARTRCPAANGSGRRSPARSSPIPTRCCSTSRCRRSTTRSSATSWTTCGAGTRRGASRCSTSPTATARRSRSATG